MQWPDEVEVYWMSHRETLQVVDKSAMVIAKQQLLAART